MAAEVGANSELLLVTEMTFLAVRKKRRRLLSTPCMLTSASMLVSIAVWWYTDPIRYGTVETHIIL